MSASSSLRKVLNEQVNELTKTVNQLEKKAKKILEDGSKSRTVRDLTKYMEQFIPASRKEMKALEKKVLQLNKKVRALEKPRKY